MVSTQPCPVIWRLSAVRLRRTVSVVDERRESMTRTAAILSLATLGAVMAVLANPRMVTSHFLASDREKAGQLMPAAHAEARSQEPSRSSPPDGTQVSGGRAWLGIRMATVTPEIAQKADLHATAGAVVVDVVPNSPAAAAGLSPGDIITKIGKTTVSTADDCRRPIAASPIGRPLVLRVLRGTVARIVVVTPTAAPEQAHNTTLPE